MARHQKAISFTAALGEGNAAFSVDRDGQGKLVLILPFTEASKVVNAWEKLMNTSFLVTLEPRKDL